MSKINKFAKFKYAVQLDFFHTELTNLIKYRAAREKIIVRQVLNFDQGLKLIQTKNKFHKISKELKFFGVRISEPNKMKQHLLFSGQNTCVKCGVVGDHFNIERFKNSETQSFNIALYGWKENREVSLTWDHIIPIALGGSDSKENAQCLCQACNVSKGHSLSIFDIAKIVTNENVMKMYIFEPTPKSPGLRKLVNRMKQDLNDICAQIKYPHKIGLSR